MFLGDVVPGRKEPLEVDLLLGPQIRNDGAYHRRGEVDAFMDQQRAIDPLEGCPVRGLCCGDVQVGYRPPQCEC